MFEHLPWQFTFSRISYLYLAGLFIVFTVIASVYVRQSPSHRFSILLPFSPTFTSLFYISSNSAFAIFALNDVCSCLYVFLLAFAYLYFGQSKRSATLPTTILKAFDRHLFSIDKIIQFYSMVLVISSVVFVASLPRLINTGLFTFNSEDKVLISFGGFDFLGNFTSQLSIVSFVVFISSISLGRSRLSSPLSIFYLCAFSLYYFISAAASGSKGAILSIVMPLWLILPTLNLSRFLLSWNLRFSKISFIIVSCVLIVTLLFGLFISPQTITLLPYLAGYYLAAPVECLSAVSFDNLQVLGGILPYHFLDILLEPFHKLGVSVQIDPGNTINNASSVLPHSLLAGTNDSFFCYAYKSDPVNLLLITLVSFVFVLLYLSALRTYYVSLRSPNGGIHYSFASLFILLHGTPFGGWSTYFVPLLRDFFCSVVIFFALRAFSLMSKPRDFFIV